MRLMQWKCFKSQFHGWLISSDLLSINKILTSNLRLTLVMSRLVLATWEMPLSKLWFYAWLQISDSGKMRVLSIPGSWSWDHPPQSQYCHGRKCHQQGTPLQLCSHMENSVDCCYYWWECLWWSRGHHCRHSSGNYVASRGRNIFQAGWYSDWKTQDCCTRTCNYQIRFQDRNVEPHTWQLHPSRVYTLFRGTLDDGETKLTFFPFFLFSCRTLYEHAVTGGVNWISYSQYFVSSHGCLSAGIELEWDHCNKCIIASRVSCSCVLTPGQVSYDFNCLLPAH